MFKEKFKYWRAKPFTIYLHDPEQRACHIRAPAAAPFGSRRAAMDFYGCVVRSFERLPAFLTSGVLRDVVLFQNLGAVDNALSAPDGRSMFLAPPDSQSLLDYSVALHSGGVASTKFGYQLIAALGGMVSPRFTPNIRKCIGIFIQEFGQGAKVRFTNSNIENLVLEPYVCRLLNGAETSDAIKSALAKLNGLEWSTLHSMRNIKDLSESRYSGWALYKGSLMGGASEEFTSFSGSSDPASEAAELTHQLVDDRVRAELFTECQFRRYKAQKVALALGVFSSNHPAIGETPADVAHRLAIVSRWRADQSQVKQIFDDESYAVVYVESDWESSSRADAFVRDAILKGHIVSYFHFDQAKRRLQTKQISLVRNAQYTTVVFGSLDPGGIFPHVQDCFQGGPVGIDGRLADENYSFSTKMIDASCLTMQIV